MEVSDSGEVSVVEALRVVTRTPWAAWRRRARRGGDVLVLRPRGASPAQRAAAAAAARSFLGRPYDPRFGWDDQRIYCSELVVKAYGRGAGISLGKRERLGDLRLLGIEKAAEQRWGGPVPKDLVLVTPASLAEDSRLDGRLREALTPATQVALDEREQRRRRIARRHHVLGRDGELEGALDGGEHDAAEVPRLASGQRPSGALADNPLQQPLLCAHHVLVDGLHLGLPHRLCADGDPGRDRGRAGALAARQPGVDEGAQPLPRGRRAPCEALVALVEELGELPGIASSRISCLLPEVVVDEPRREVRPARDRLDRGPLVPSLGHDREEGVHDLLPSLFPVRRPGHALSRGPRGPSWSTNQICLDAGAPASTFLAWSFNQDWRRRDDPRPPGARRAPRQHGAVRPFSANPITCGHVDVVERVSRRVVRVVVGIGRNPTKTYLFSLEARLRLARQALAHLPGVTVLPFQGMVVDFATEQGAQVIVKGVRNAADFDYEQVHHLVGLSQRAGIDTHVLFADPRLAHVSSSAVKAIQLEHGFIHELVPPW